MDCEKRTLERRVQGLRVRISSLGTLRRVVGLPRGADIRRRQWSALEPRLGALASRLLGRLRRAAGAHLAEADSPRHARRLHAVLGEIELETSAAFTFFDTYADVLTQRHAHGLGRLLAGCDVLALEAIRRDHPALSLVEPPLVFCDRGFGASIVREDVPLPGGGTNPLPLIQIPYSRLLDKCNLTSIYHEAGHQALSRLGLVRVLPAVLRAGLLAQGASLEVADLYSLWASEIGPDFWSFCLAGPAAAATLRDILALPPAHAFRVSWTDPHPPAYVRTLLGFECCRQAWGRGSWDGWEEQWRSAYPLSGLADEQRRVIVQATRVIPAVAALLAKARYRALGGRAIPDLFELEALNPQRLASSARQIGRGGEAAPALGPAAQLASFRMARELCLLDEEALDGLMTPWLTSLPERGTRDPMTMKRGVEAHA
jgi:hypothetical protein